jgi:hypothetical protein
MFPALDPQNINIILRWCYCERRLLPPIKKGMNYVPNSFLASKFIAFIRQKLLRIVLQSILLVSVWQLAWLIAILRTGLRCDGGYTVTWVHLLQDQLHSLFTSWSSVLCKSCWPKLTFRRTILFSYSGLKRVGREILIAFSINICNFFPLIA